jgi:H+/Cl- antiporter ClcA
MFAETIKNRILNQFHFKFLLKWILVSIIVGGLSGSASAWFLIALEWAKDVRNRNSRVLSLLGKRSRERE